MLDTSPNPSQEKGFATQSVPAEPQNFLGLATGAQGLLKEIVFIIATP